jgi:hypothetical protein
LDGIVSSSTGERGPTRSPPVTTLKCARFVGADMSDAGGRPCPACDRPMTHRHCKYVCPEHGVVYDCSDTFY